MKDMASRAWQYMRELEFIDSQDRADLKQWYSQTRPYVWFGFIVAMFVGSATVSNEYARVASLIVCVSAMAFLIWTWLSKDE
jgi:hypothetical protein